MEPEKKLQYMDLEGTPISKVSIMHDRSLNYELIN